MTDLIPFDIENYIYGLFKDMMQMEDLVYYNELFEIYADLLTDKEKEAQRDAEAAGDDDSFESELFDEDKKAFLNDEDFQQLQDFIEEEELSDEEYLAQLIEQDEELI